MQNIMKNRSGKGEVTHEWGRGKQRKLRSMWLMYSVYKNEYRIFKLVETTIRRGLK
jgi:hypothetical protein